MSVGPWHDRLVPTDRADGRDPGHISMPWDRLTYARSACTQTPRRAPRIESSNRRPSSTRVTDEDLQRHHDHHSTRARRPTLALVWLAYPNVATFVVGMVLYIVSTVLWLGYAAPASERAAV